jgi:hypothetical protein
VEKRRNWRCPAWGSGGGGIWAGWFFFFFKVKE